MAGNIGDAFPVGATAPPAIGTVGPGFANTINDILTEAIGRLTAKVKTASIDPANADLDFNTAYAAKNLAYASLASLSAAPSGAPFGRLARYAGNLYYVDAAGAVQITSGASLNASALGGITGLAAPAAVAYVGASQTYEFYADQAGGLWAILKAKRLDLVNTGGFVTQLTPSAAMAASFAMTLPSAAFPSTSLMAMTAAGQIQTAQAAAVTQFSVNADGIKHTDLVEMLEMQYRVVSGSPLQNTTTGEVSASTAGDNRFKINLPFKAVVGRRIKAATARIVLGGAPATVKIFKSVDGAAAVQCGATGTQAAAGGPFSVTATATEVVAANTHYWVEVEFTNAGAGLVYRVYNVSVTFDYV